MLNRAYSVLTIKAIDAEKRLIAGVATSPEPDRVGDIVEPLGAKFSNPLPLLLFHDGTRPVGTVKLQKPTADGIRFEAQIPDIPEPGTLKDRVDEAWQSIKAKLVRGVSIGFRTLDDGIELLRSGGVRFTKIEIVELSLVAIPANRDATIDSIKSLDAPYLAALGTDSCGDPSPAGAPAPREATSSRKAIKPAVKTIGEQIKEFEATRQAKNARMTELMTTSGEKGETLDENAAQEYDELECAVESIDKHLTRLRALEKTNIEAAKPAIGTDVKAGSDSRGGHVVTVAQPKLPPGIGFARAVKTAIVARLDSRNMLDVAKEMYPSDERLHAHITHVTNLPKLIAQIKAAVPAATTTNTTWASALVDPTNLAEEFIEFLRPATIIGRLNLRTVPFNVRMIEQTQGGTGYWVGQGAPKPLTAFGYTPVQLGPTKVAAIAVATEEAVRFSIPSLDTLIRDGLRDALVERIDRDLLDPAEAGTTNVQPASLTNGLTPLTSSGTSADNVRADLATLVRALRSANLRGPIAIVMPDSLVTVLTFMVNALGQSEFPDLSAEGGTIRGLRVIGSEYVANASGAGNMVVAIAEREVFLADDGSVRVDASREASLQMLDNPTNNSATATATQMVSMWQTDSIAFRAERFINWQKRRAEAVAYMDDVNWGSVGSP